MGYKKFGGPYTARFLATTQLIFSSQGGTECDICREMCIHMIS